MGAPTWPPPRRSSVFWQPAARLDKLAPFVVFTLTFIVFFHSVQGEFLYWDDRHNFVNNPSYRGLGWAQLRWMWTSTLLGHYIPLTWMTFGLNYVLGGMNPWGYHFGNVLLHATNALMFYVLTRRLLLAAGTEGGAAGAESGAAATESGAAAWGAAFAALVFGIHPLRVESVAWVTERRDVLYAFFFLVSVLAYGRSIETWGTAAHRWRLVSLVAFAASILSKSLAMTLPVALLIIDVYPLRRVARLGWKRVLIEKAPYALLGFGAAVIALVAVGKAHGFTAYEDYGAAARVAIACYSVVFYPTKWLWPVGLSPLYELPRHVNPFAMRFLVSIIATLAVTGVLAALRRHWPGALAAWVYSGLTLLPVSGIVHAGLQLVNDRYSYVSGFGFAVLAGGVLARDLRVTEPRPSWSARTVLSAAMAVMLVVVLGFGAWRQTKIWRDSEALWHHAIAVDSGCATCWDNLGEVLVDGGRRRDAMQAYRVAIALRPDRAIAHTDLGLALLAEGRLEGAEAELREALRLDPTSAVPRVNLGKLYARDGRWEESIALLRSAFQARPDFANLRRDLAWILRARGIELVQGRRYTEAIARFREALELQPEDGETRGLLEQALGGAQSLGPRSP